MNFNSSDPREKEFMPQEELGELVWGALLDWMNGGRISPEARAQFIERSSELRLRMQAVMMEIQRRFLSQVANESEFEDVLRRSIREDLPYMTAKEKLEALKILQSSTEDRMKRLEAQLAGFDFFNTIQASIQSMSDTKVNKSLATAVTAMPTARRQQLLTMLNDIVANAGQPTEQLGTTDAVIDTPAIPPDGE